MLNWPKEIHIADLVWQGLTNREIGKMIGTTEQVIKNHLRATFDKLGYGAGLSGPWYVASYGGRAGLKIRIVQAAH